MTHEGWGAAWAKARPPVAHERARAGALSPRRRRQLRAQRRRQAVKAALIALAALVLLGGVAGALLVRDAVTARDALESASRALPGLEARLREDPEAVAGELARVQSQARIAASAAHGPLWSLARGLPVVGDDLRAFQQITRVVDDLAQEVLPRVSAVATSVTPAALAPQDGRIPLDLLVESRSDIVAANAAIESGIERVRALPRDGVLAEIADAADTLQTQLEELHGTSVTAARAAELLPPLLGAHGQREWLVLAQNNAEPRATGGIPGAILHLVADDGAVSIEGKASGRDFGRIDPPVAELTAAEAGLFGEDLVRFSQNLTMTPDFPRTGELAVAAWTQVLGDDPRGVLSIDPVALGMLLRATGPIDLWIPVHDDDPAAVEVPEDPLPDPGAPDDGESPIGGVAFGGVAFGDGRPLEAFTLTAENAATFLLSEIYLRYADPTIHDDVFAVTAEAVFAALLGPGVDVGAALDALVEAAQDGRLMVWSAEPAEQALLAGTILSGELRGAVTLPDGEVAPQVGVFLNLTLAGKQGFFLDREAVVEDAVVRPNGSQELTVRVRLTSTMDPATAADLPVYVIGDTDGTIRTNVLVYAPAGGAVLAAERGDGTPLALFSQVHDDLAVTVHTAVIAPGESVEYVFRVRTGPGQTAPAQVRLTPGAHAH